MMAIRLLLLALLVALAAPIQAQDARALGSVTLDFIDETGQYEPIQLYTASHALLIGVSDYTAGWPDLPGVPDDIAQVKAALERHGFEVKIIGNPTSSDMRNAINYFIAQYGRDPESRLIVYYAGHGHTRKLSWGGEMGYLIPADCPRPDRDVGGFSQLAIDMEQVEVWAKRIESKHALFLFDSCFSGSIFALSRAVPASISLKTTKPIRQFITSGSANQEVPDKSDFRREFVRALDGDGDTNGDGYVTGSELGEYLYDRVTNYSSGAQTPQYGKIRNPMLDRGDFVFQVPRRGVAGQHLTTLAPLPDTSALDDIYKSATQMETERKRQEAERKEQLLAAAKQAFEKAKWIDERVPSATREQKAQAWRYYLDSFRSADYEIAAAEARLGYWSTRVQPTPTPTSAPLAPSVATGAAAGVLVSGPFPSRAGSLGMPWKTYLDTWAVHNGELRVNMGVPYVHGWALYDAPNCRDYAIEFDLQHRQARFCVCFRVNSDVGGYWLDFSHQEQRGPSGGASAPAEVAFSRFEFRDENRANTLGAGVTETFASEKKADHVRTETAHYRIEVRGNSMRVFRNGREWLSATDRSGSPLTSGGFGFAGSTGWFKPCVATISNLRVTEL